MMMPADFPIDKKERAMITCFIEYTIDANKITEFEHYAKLWISLVNKLGGQHMGYFLPSEGANNIPITLQDPVSELS